MEWFPGDDSFLKWKFAFPLLIPLALLSGIAIIWLSAFMFLRRWGSARTHDSGFISTFKGFMISAAFVTFYIMFPGIAKTLADSINCRQISEEGLYVMNQDPDVPCFGDEHKMILLTITLPGTLLLVVLPVALIIYTIIKFKSKFIDYLDS